MALGPNTVDRDALGNPLVDVGNHSGGDLGVVGNVEVVVIDVQLGGRVSGARCSEGNANKVLAENTAEDAVAECAVFGKDLVEDIPLDDLALVMSDHGGNVVLENRGQGGTVSDSRDPAWQLGVPEEVVATDKLAVCLSKGDNFIGVAELEVAAAWLNSIPLHAVLRGDLAKDVLDNSGQGVVSEMVMIDLGSEVNLALGLELGVQAARAAVSSSSSGGRSALSGGRVSCLRGGGWVASSRSGQTLRVKGIAESAD